MMFINCQAFAAQNYDFDFISEDKIELANNNIKVSGVLPKIDVNKFKNKDFARLINQKINSAYKKELERAVSDKQQQLKINYQVKARKNIVSLPIFFSNRCVNTINFNLKTCQFVNITDVLGPNAIEITDSIIKDNIIKSPQKYNVDFKGITDEHNFYVDENNLVITFNGYELSPAIKDIQKFIIDINSVVNKAINKNEYYTTKPYNLKMIPLREICEAFNYKLTWNKSSYSAQIANENLNVSILVNRNGYIKNNGAVQTLESAAQIKNEKVYVPISFFSKYLDLIYSIDENNQITFSRYK